MHLFMSVIMHQRRELSNELNSSTFEQEYNALFDI